MDRSSILRVVAGYAVLAAAWILFFDALLYPFWPEAASIHHGGLIKALAFLLITALGLGASHRATAPGFSIAKFLAAPERSASVRQRGFYKVLITNNLVIFLSNSPDRQLRGMGVGYDPHPGTRRAIQPKPS